jgi:DNA-binding NarL/FixJ family response regulator
MKLLSVLVADHHPLFAEGIRSVLSVPVNQVSYNITAVARTTEQVEGYLGEHRSDLLLLDITLPGANEQNWLAELKLRFPSLKVLVITNQNDAVSVQAFIKRGADGYLLKTTSKDELRNAIREVSEGQQFIGRGVSNPNLVGNLTIAAAPSSTEAYFAKKYNLTRREIEIVRYIGQALTNKEIGDRLYISDQTVSVHRKNIMRKLRVNSTASLVRMVFEHQIPLTAG